MTPSRQTTGGAEPAQARLRNGYSHPGPVELPLDRPEAGVVGLHRAAGPGARLRILVADHHEVVRIGLKSILESRSGWQVVAEADNGKETIARAAQSRPDVVIVDASLPLIDGVEVARQIRMRLPATEILVIAAYESEALVNDALVAGVRAMVLRSDAKGELIAAVTSLAAHKPFFGGRLSEQLLQTFLSAKSSAADTALSPRERSVVQLIAEGHSNRQIGDLLSLSVKTIETHRATAMRKLGAGSTAALVRYAIRNGLIEP